MKDKDRKKILIAYDGSECAESALDDLQRAGLPRYADVLVVTIAEELIPAPASIGGVDTTFPSEELEAERASLALARQARARLHALFPDWEITAEAGLGTPGRRLVERADAWSPDLIVVGSHGRGALGRLLFGSVSQKVVHEARCSVRVARGRVIEPANTPVRLVVGVDGSKASGVAIHEIASRRWPRDSKVFVVNAAWTLPPIADQAQVIQVSEWIARENERVKEMVESAVRKLQAAELKVTAIVKEQEPRKLLCEVAESHHADCIFVGAKGMGGVERFVIGSVSAGVAARAHCSVEIVRR